MANPYPNPPKALTLGIESEAPQLQGKEAKEDANGTSA
jgi:hypothetical protein